MLPVDNLKALFTYIVALVVVVGGGLMLWGSRADAESNFSLLVAGFIGSALTFVFGQEVQTRTARQTTSAIYTPVPTPNAAPDPGAPDPGPPPAP